MTRWLVLVACTAGLALMTGCSEGAADGAGADRPADPVAQGARKARVCTSCHGPAGVSRTASYPSLAGLDEAYITEQLHRFKKGDRQNPVMQSMVASLSATDIDHLAAFFSAQPVPGATHE